jgi:hypothetical protein
MSCPRRKREERRRSTEEIIQEVSIIEELPIIEEVLVEELLQSSPIEIIEDQELNKKFLDLLDENEIKQEVELSQEEIKPKKGGRPKKVK